MTGATVTRASAPDLRLDRIQSALFGAWAVACGAALAVRPGALLEVALIGVAGGLALATAGRDVEARTLALAGIAFALPLSNTWPARAWEGGTDRLPAPLGALVSPVSLLLVPAAFLVLRDSSRTRPPRLIVLGGVALLSGAVLAGLASKHPSASLGAAWLEFGVPTLIGWLVFRSGLDPRAGWVVLKAALAAVLVPAVVGIAAYLLDFGLPTDTHDLTEGKIALARQHLFQEVTFGNVGHFAALAVLLLPVAVTVTLGSSIRPLERIVGGAATLGLAVVLLLVLSRFALAFAALAGSGLAGLFVLRGLARRAAVPVALCAVFVGVLLSPSVRSLNEQSPGASVAAPGLSPVSPPGGNPGGSPLGGRSAAVRESAMRTGFRVAGDHAPLGVGPERYAVYDPVHTSPHSLPLLIVAEDGVLGGLGLLALYAWLLIEIVRVPMAVRRPAQSGSALRAACAVGSLGFLSLALVAGVPLVLGNSNVWPGLVALQIAVAASLRPT